MVGTKLLVAMTLAKRISNDDGRDEEELSQSHYEIGWSIEWDISSEGEQCLESQTSEIGVINRSSSQESLRKQTTLERAEMEDEESTKKTSKKHKKSRRNQKRQPEKNRQSKQGRKLKRQK